MKRREIDPGLAGECAEAVRQRGPLAGLEPELAARFLRLGALLELAQGEALMREGEPAVEFYLLVEGSLTVQAQGATIAQLRRRGDVIGETAVLLSTPRTADVFAESAVRAVAIPAKALALPEFSHVAAGIRSAMLRDDWVQY